MSVQENSKEWKLDEEEAPMQNVKEELEGEKKTYLIKCRDKIETIDLPSSDFNDFVSMLRNSRNTV